LRSRLTYKPFADRRGAYAEFYLNSPYAVFPQEHRALPGPRPSTMIMVDQGRHELTDPAIDELIVTIPLAAHSCAYAWDMGEGWSGVRSQTGDLIVVPPHVESRWRVGGERRLLIFAIPVETVAQILGPECPSDLSAAFGAIAGSSAPNELVQQLMLRLWQLGNSVDPLNRLLRESALSALVCHLLSLSRTTAEPSRTNVIAARDMRRLIEYVDVHLHEEIGLNDLAATGGWSVRHFTRVFRQSTSETPHRWLMARRVERAKHLLGSRNLSLAEIALTCGFADQSHFTTCFRQVTGATPMKWRKDLF
jgi:AraC family transcriptional regulator